MEYVSGPKHRVPFPPVDIRTGKVRVYDIQTGQPVDLFPIDAKEQVQMGIVSWDKPGEERQRATTKDKPDEEVRVRITGTSGILVGTKEEAENLAGLPPEDAKEKRREFKSQQKSGAMTMQSDHDKRAWDQMSDDQLKSLAKANGVQDVDGKSRQDLQRELQGKNVKPQQPLQGPQGQQGTQSGQQRGQGPSPNPPQPKK